MILPADLPDTRVFDADEGALVRFPHRFLELRPGSSALFVADPATWNAAGRDLYGAFRAAGVATPRPLVFGEAPRADLEALSVLGGFLREAPADAVPVAVGGGTVAALCKRAAHEAGRPWLCFATAPSTDAFVAPGSLIEDPATGVSSLLPCPGPLALAAEPEVLARAPAATAAAGYASLMSALLAGADWLAAAAVGAEGPVEPSAWRLAQDGLSDRLLRPRETAQGDESARASLFEGLASVGLAAQRARTPRPLCGAPHLFARVWSASGAAPAGGLALGLGSLCALAVWDRLLAAPFRPEDVEAAVGSAQDWDAREAFVSSLFPVGARRDEALAACRAKHLGADELRERLGSLATLWPALKEKLDELLMNFPRMRAMLTAAGCETDPAAFGLSPLRLGASALAAQLLGPAHTVLDLAFETGRLPACADAVRAAFASA